MLCQLYSSNDNGQSILIHPSGMKSARSVVIVHDDGQRMVNHP